MRKCLFVLIAIIWFSNVYGAEQLRDEIVFFNVGQGHAALVNKVGGVPLLVDAGSRSRPYTLGEMYEWTNEHVELTFISQISEKILDYWKGSNAGSLIGGRYHLNIIITHPDEDHNDFIPLIFTRLREASQRYGFIFFPHALLGGTEFHYNGYYLPGCDGGYSSTILGLRTRTKGNLKFLESSDCITHLFCPDGGNDTNRWSIIVRLQINGMSVMLTGDADAYVKRQMLQALEALEGNGRNLASDILLAPHHGSNDNTYYQPWDHAVNPKAIIIGAAPNKSKRGANRQGNLHPRGETILNFLYSQERRIWENTVMSHCVLYNCNQQIHSQIQDTFGQRQFDVVPNPAVPSGELERKWHVVWVNIPLYTLWTTGTLIFRENINTPQFVDAPNGVMTYIAVREFKYLLNPDERIKNPLLVNLLDLFLARGEGNGEGLTRLVETLSAQRSSEIEREGIVLTGGLSLYENRANILRTLLSIPPQDWEEILELASPLLHPNKNISSRYRILEILKDTPTEGRAPFIHFLRDHCLLIPEDAQQTATIMEIFSQATLEEAQEILEMLHSFFPIFKMLSYRERKSMLEVVKALLDIDRINRSTLFQHAQPFLLANELNDVTENHQNTFHDVDNNASLINIFASLNPESVPEFSQHLHEVWHYLMSDQLGDLYGENKHYCINALLNIPFTNRLNFLREILPILTIIHQKRFESWVIGFTAEKLSNIYSQPHFHHKLEYLLGIEANKHNKEDSVFNPNTLEQYLNEFNFQ